MYSKRPDGQADIKVLHTVAVGQCRNTLNRLGTFKVTLLRALDHMRGSVLSSQSVDTVCVSLATIRSRIYSHYLAAADFRWRRLTTYAKSRRLRRNNSHCRSCGKEGDTRRYFRCDCPELQLFPTYGHQVNHSLTTSVRSLGAGRVAAFVRRCYGLTLKV